MSTLGHFIMTFFIAMLPVLELRGAIPIGTAAGLDPRLALLAAFLGNLVPVPFIVIFIRKIFVWLRTKSEFLDRVVARMEAKAEKNADKVHKYENVGLFILVAIPFPGTGAWTGALVAAFLDMRLKRCFPAIALGVLAAGIIVFCLTYGVSALL